MMPVIMINLDYQNRSPIYEQIVTTIENYVALGILKPKEQIPSIRELASNLGINPNTVKKAYDILETKKIINTISTKGTFISDKTNEVLETKKIEEIKKLNKQIDTLLNLGITNQEIKNIINNKLK